MVRCCTAGGPATSPATSTGASIGTSRRIGYPLHSFVPDDHAANEEDFFPVVASLEALDHLVRVAPTGTHLGDLRGEYLRVVGAVDSLRTADW